MTKYIRQAFEGVGGVLRETFLPRLLFGSFKTLSPVVKALSTFPVNTYGLGLHNPVMSAADKYTRLLHASYKLIGSVTGETELINDNHLWSVKDEIQDRKK